MPVPENGAHTCQPAAPARGDVLSDGTWIRTPEEERAATAPARDEPPMTPPYAVLADGSIVPLMNCPECNEMGRADMAHYHVCKRVCTEAEQAVLDAIGKAFIYQDTRGAAVFAIPSEEGDICRAELARRGLKT